MGCIHAELTTQQEKTLALRAWWFDVSLNDINFYLYSNVFSVTKPSETNLNNIFIFLLQTLNIIRANR